MSADVADTLNAVAVRLGGMAMIERALAGQRITLSNEKDAQAQIAAVFDRKELVFQREVPVANGIIDFMVGSIGVEVKLSGQRRAIFRQLVGYAEDPGIDGLVLVTASAMGLPPRISGKPAMVISLGKAWL